MRRAFQSILIGSLLLLSSLASAQYEAEPFIEGFVGGNYSLPTAYVKNDLVPATLNATGGIGLDLGIGYHFRPNIVGGVYFNNRNLGTDGAELNHRAFEFGAYGKYVLATFAEGNVLPYVKASAGIVFDKMATKVYDNGMPKLRELSYKPALGAELALGLHYRTNSYGGVYAEVAYHGDMMDGVKGVYESTNYLWGDNNFYLMLKAGVVFNIGPKE